MTDSIKYNGWTNYATWRVNLEMFDGSDCAWTAESAKEYVEDIIISTTDEGIARDYALAFLADVNWYEIAEHYIENAMEEFFVTLIEDGQEEEIVFACRAEDKEHAKEQALNAYPGCEIIQTV